MPEENTARRIVIVGGGFSGLWCALLTARAGYKTTLIERHKIGHAGSTSMNSLRILHGGLRYLQNLNLRRFSESVRARGCWFEELEEVHQERFYLPVTGKGLRRTIFFFPAMLLNDILNRVCGVSNWPRSSIEKLNSQVAGYSKWAVWSDGVIQDPALIAQTLMRLFESAGGQVLQDTQVLGIQQQGGSVSAIQTNRGLIDCDVVVNCTNGEWIPESITDEPLDWAIGANVVLNRQLAEFPFGISGKGSTTSGQAATRDFFFLPVGQSTLAGTTYMMDCRRDTDVTEIENAVIVQLLEELNALPLGQDVSRESVSEVLWGWLPVSPKDRTLLSNTRIQSSTPGYWSVHSAKLTTAPTAAESLLMQINNHFS